MKLFVIIYFALIIGCTNGVSNKNMSLTDKHSAIYEAALRYAFNNNDSSLKYEAEFYIVELEDEMSANFFRRFDDISKPIYSISMVSNDCKKGIYLKNSSRRGIQFFVGSPEVVSENKIKILWNYYEGCTSSALSIMTLEFRSGAWVVIDDEVIVIS